MKIRDLCASMSLVTLAACAGTAAADLSLRVELSFQRPLHVLHRLIGKP